MNWPDDADGDALRRLEEHGLDFSVPHAVDFNVDFDEWPPSYSALAGLQERFGSVESYPPSDGQAGYVLLRVLGLVSYEWVTSVQRDVTALMAPFGGVCESWGLLH